MKLSIHAVGRLRDSRWKKLYREYIDRLGHYLPTDSRDIRESSASDAAQRQREEAQSLLASLPQGAIVVVLDERGVDKTSEELAEWVEERMVRGTRYVTFLIGGPEGHADETRQEADLVLRLSALTLPHEMARTVLAEQLYRAMTIIRGEPYHR